MSRLNLWQRLGVVLSVLWILGAGYWGRMADLNEAKFWKDLSYRKCVEHFPAGTSPDRKACVLEAEKVSDLFLANSWENVAIFVLGALIAGWIIAFAVSRIARWVLAGRKPTT